MQDIIILKNKSDQTPNSSFTTPPDNDDEKIKPIKKQMEGYFDMTTFWTNCNNVLYYKKLFSIWNRIY